MKKINFFSTSKKALVALVCSVSFVVLFSACYDDVGTSKKYCKEQGKLWCPEPNNNDKGAGCCDSSVPWYDGHGTCYSSLSYCRQTGWNCVHCRTPE